MLFTFYRSGSTFTGQLLNQHPDVFYLFEPLILAAAESGRNTYKKELLTKLFNCSLPLYSDHNEDQPGYVKDNCARRNFCFAHGTKVSQTSNKNKKTKILFENS